MAHVFSNRVQNDLQDHSRSFKVIGFGTNQKHLWDFLLVLNSNLGPIMPHFRDIRAFVCRKPLFAYLPLFQSKF